MVHGHSAGDTAWPDGRATESRRPNAAHLIEGGVGLRTLTRFQVLRRTVDGWQVEVAVTGLVCALLELSRALFSHRWVNAPRPPS